MGIETGGQNIGSNNAGAMGLMQIVGDIWQQTANQYGGDLMDPWTNIRTAAHILKSNYDTYGSWDKAAAAYFGGGGAFNADGSFSDNADYFGTNISQYVGIFRNNMAALGYGQPSAAEYSAGGAAATPWGQSAVNNAMSAQGTPYVWGGEEPGGFDCSGLMQWAYGGKLDNARTAEQQYYATQRINGSDLQAGDLIFFNTIGGISHVGMYIGNGQMVHAPKENDIVKVVSLDNDFWRNATVGYGRVT
jgi:cell wall-associated NlpC family hydrolase